MEPTSHAPQTTIMEDRAKERACLSGVCHSSPFVFWCMTTPKSLLLLSSIVLIPCGEQKKSHFQPSVKGA